MYGYRNSQGRSQVIAPSAGQMFLGAKLGDLGSFENRLAGRLTPSGWLMPLRVNPSFLLHGRLRHRWHPVIVFD